MATVSCLRPTPVLPGSNLPEIDIPELQQPVLRELPPLPTFALPRGVSDFPLKSPIVLYWLATLARASYSPTNAFFQSAARAVVPASYPITFVPNGPAGTPGYAIITLPLCLIVVVSGTTNLGQWQDQIFSGDLVSSEIYGSASVDKGNTMASYKTSADTINTAIAGISATLPVLLVGHSMGGAVAQVLHYRYSQNPLGRGVPRCVTFASPKPGNSNLVGGMRTNSTHFRRLIISGDFVPALPPDLGLLRVVAPAVFRGVADTWARYRSAPPAYYLNRSGVLTAGDEPFIPALMIAALITASLGQPLALLDVHLMKTFVTYLRASFTSFDESVTSNWGNPSTLEVVNAGMAAAGL